MVTNDDLLANTTLSVSRLHAEIAALREKMEIAEGMNVAFELAHAGLRQRIEQLEAGLRQARNCFETLCDVAYTASLPSAASDLALRAAQAIDALLAAQPPDGKKCCCDEHTTVGNVHTYGRCLQCPVHGILPPDSAAPQPEGKG